MNVAVHEWFGALLQSAGKHACVTAKWRGSKEKADPASLLCSTQQPAAGTAVGGNEPPLQGRASSQGLSFELPFVSKFLLVAAYIASRNKPTSDRQVRPLCSRSGARCAGSSHGHCSMQQRPSLAIQSSSQQ